MATISVVAGGWSLIGVDLSRVPGRVIGVNEAAVAAPRIDIAISMDRLFVENRWDQLKRRAGATWIRRGTNRNCSGVWLGLVIFDCDHQSAVFTGRNAGHALNGPHSGFCGLNLAYRLAERDDRVLLFGFDHNRGAAGRAYWHDDYPWRPGGATTGGKYQAWARQYAAAAEAFDDAGVEVINASPTSAIGVWPKVDPRKVLV